MDLSKELFENLTKWDIFHFKKDNTYETIKYFFNKDFKTLSSFIKEGMALDLGDLISVSFFKTKKYLPLYIRENYHILFKDFINNIDLLSYFNEIESKEILVCFFKLLKQQEYTRYRFSRIINIMYSRTNLSFEEYISTAHEIGIDFNHFYVCLEREGYFRTCKNIKQDILDIDSEPSFTPLIKSRLSLLQGLGLRKNNSFFEVLTLEELELVLDKFDVFAFGQISSLRQISFKHFEYLNLLYSKGKNHYFKEKYPLIIQYKPLEKEKEIKDFTLHLLKMARKELGYTQKTILDFLKLFLTEIEKYNYETFSKEVMKTFVLNKNLKNQIKELFN